MAAQRKALNITQRDLVARLATRGIELPQSAIAKVENGTREPKIAEVFAIARILNIDLDDLDADPVMNAIVSQSTLTDTAGAARALLVATLKAADALDRNLIEGIEEVREVFAQKHYKDPEHELGEAERATIIDRAIQKGLYLNEDTDLADVVAEDTPTNRDHLQTIVDAALMPAEEIQAGVPDA